jgi:putative endonuclease
MPRKQHPKGKLGEDLAAAFLLKLGYKILTRNFNSRLGEIDIIAVDKTTLVYVEVKTRTSESYGTAEEAVTSYKMQRFLKTIEYYKLLNPSKPSLERIDVIAVSFDQNNRPQINHLKNVTG